MRTTAHTIGFRRVLLFFASFGALAGFSLFALEPALAQAYPSYFYNTVTFTLTSNMNPSMTGDPVTLTADVGSQFTGQSVTFYDDTTALGTVQVDADGMAAFTTSSLRVGSHPVTATLDSGGEFPMGTSQYLYQVVDVNNMTSNETDMMVNTQTTATGLGLYVDESPVEFGEVVGFSAFVSGMDRLGTVTFYDDGAPLASSYVHSDGSAGYSTSQLSLGTHTITATFSNQSGTPTLTSPPVTLEVIQGDTTPMYPSNNVDAPESDEP